MKWYHVKRPSPHCRPLIPAHVHMPHNVSAYQRMLAVAMTLNEADNRDCITVLLDRVQSAKWLPVRIHDAEAIALRVGKDHVVRVGRSPAPLHLGGAQCDQALNLSCLVVCVEVKVNAWRHVDL